MFGDVVALHMDAGKTDNYSFVYYSKKPWLLVKHVRCALESGTLCHEIELNTTTFDELVFKVGCMDSLSKTDVLLNSCSIIILCFYHQQKFSGSIASFLF